MKTPSLRAFTTLAVAALALLVTTTVRAQTTVYSNVATLSGSTPANSTVLNGGAATNGANFITRTVADDLTLTNGMQGQAVTGFSFSVANLNNFAVSARPVISFYAGDGTGGGPGSLLNSFTFNAVPMNGISLSVLTFNPGTSLFSVPADLRLWAGLSFDNGGSSTATQSSLNNLGQGLFNPPTIGSSADVFFQSSTAGAPASNPAGSLSNLGGTPPANLAWAVFGTPIPEPSTWGLLGAGALTLMWIGRRRPRADRRNPDR